MRALVVNDPVSDARALLELTRVRNPTPVAGEVLVRVLVCGVCRTDLDVAEGRVIAPRYPVIPGHQVVGRVVATNAPATSVREGDRVGIAWIHFACGACRWCRSGDENLCPNFRST